MEDSVRQTPDARGRHCRIVRNHKGWTVDVGDTDLLPLALDAMRAMAELPLPPKAASLRPCPDFGGMETFQASSAAPTAPEATRAVQTSAHEGNKAVDDRMTLGRSMVEYLDEYLPTDSSLNHKGRTECRASLELFLQMTGDRPVKALTRKHCKEFIAKLKCWPAHSSKKKEFRDLADPDLIIAKAKELNADLISPVTLRNRFNYVAGWIRWLKESGEIENDPLTKCVLPTARRELDRRPPTSEEIQIIFDAKNRETLVAPYNYWAPLLGLYTGARVREIGQLYLDDIDHINGVNCIHIAVRHPFQQLKTESSARVIPIHPELERLGFLKYVEELRAKGESKLFPGLPWLGGKDVKDPGRKISRNFNETYLRHVCDIQDPAVSFHSFRHFFATCANRSKMEDARIARLTGHALERGGSLRSNYIQVATLPERLEDIKTLEFPALDLAPYEPGRFDRWFKSAKQKVRAQQRFRRPQSPRTDALDKARGKGKGGPAPEGPSPNAAA